jgi:type IV fimbrial biogenesis protein FimT
MSKNRKGFTIIELLVVLTVAIIFVALSVPSFFSIRQNNNAVLLTNNFAGTLNYARAEAIKRGELVSVCASANTNQTACGNAGSWTNGWIVFVDNDGDGVIDGGDEILRVGAVLDPGATFTAPVAFITYDSEGFVSSGAGDYGLAATGCDGNNGRTLTISNAGRVSIANVACP